MTSDHCCYCDVVPLDGAEVDHFRPKSRPEFYDLVCDWDNLLVSCGPCNNGKGEDWDPRLLRPDEPGFAFARYFVVDFETGAISPNNAATEADQQRAQVTIDTLKLYRPAAKKLRKVMWNVLRRADAGERPLLACRFLADYF